MNVNLNLIPEIATSLNGNKKAAQLQAALVLFSAGLERVKKNSNYLSTAMEETSLTIFH